jgi:hypothetical protein
MRDTGEAQACFRRAIEVARRQSARALEQRAVAGLAELGTRSEAKEPVPRM